MLQCQQITDDLVKQRADYLVRRGQELSVKTEVNPNLEEWFSNDPVERIVTLEAAITARKRELARTAGAGAGAGTRPVSPGIRCGQRRILVLSNMFNVYCCAGSRRWRSRTRSCCCRWAPTR